MTFRVAVLGVVIAVGVTGTLVTLRAREADTAFVSEQTSLTRLSSPAVEAVVRTAPVLQGRPGSRASCRPEGTGQLRNPWRCGISYASGRTFSFVVTVAPDGSYVGRPAKSGGGFIKGCCIAVAGAG